MSSSHPPSRGGARRLPPEQAARKVAATAAQQVRIIGGQWRRTALPVPVVAGLRPTPSRVRETLFNWLGQDLQGWRVLDAFAGTGALGFEAASRGAQEVVLLEREPQLLRSLQAIKRRLDAACVDVQQADALSWMKQARHAGRFDLVFLDPPFDGAQFEQAALLARACIPDGGWIYLEASEPFTDLPGLKLHRHGQAGAVNFHLFRRVEEAAATAADQA